MTARQREQARWTAIWVALLLAVPPAYPQTAKPFTIYGKLTRDDPLDRVRSGSHHKVHEVELHEKQTYVIELRSMAFDTYLRVENDEGKQVAHNDDISTVDLDSRARYTPEKTGKYRLIVTSYQPNQIGKYSITVQTKKSWAKAKEHEVSEGHSSVRRIRELNARSKELYDSGRSVEALTPAREALKIAERVYAERDYPQGHAELARSLLNLGVLLGSTGSYDQALVTLERALAMHKGLYPRGHEVVALTLNNMGALYHERGEYAKALSYHNQTVRMYRSIFTRDNPMIAHALNDAGSALRSMGDYGKALPVYEESLAILLKFPSEEVRIAASLSNVGLTLESIGEYGKALPYLERALDIRKRLYQRAHPDLARGLSRSSFITALA